jgi:hypothetical protein
MSSRKADLDKERLRLLEVGAGIRLTRVFGIPMYNWTGRVPYCKETIRLVDALVDEFWPGVGKEADYVVVYDNGGQSLPLADLLSQEIGRRSKRAVGLVIVRRTKHRGRPGRWRVWYRRTPTSQPIRLRTDADFDLIRRKNALFFVDVLEWHRKIIDVARSARNPKNGIRILGISCLVKRDGRMRRAYLPNRIGEAVSLFCLVDREFLPHKAPRDFEDLPRGKEDEEPLTPSPSLLSRITRRIRSGNRAAL